MHNVKDTWFNSSIYKDIERIICRYYSKRLTNSDFTILCSNCLGGCIYHRLNMQFLSPTINLHLDQHDFVKFLLHLDYYCNEELHFINCDASYPVGTLGGSDYPEIKINFTHYKNEEEARDKWNKRVKRINKDNLYIIMYNIQDITIEELHQLDNYPCNNKALINWKEMPEIEWSVHVDPGKKNNYLARNILGLRQYERKWDFISFLNKK